MYFDVDIEEAILGTLMAYNSSIYRVSDLIPEDSFYDPLHQFMYDCIVELSKNSKVDIMTVSVMMGEKKSCLPQRLQETSFPYICSTYTNKVASDYHLENHVEILLRFRTKRKMLEMSNIVIRDIEHGMDIDEVIHKASTYFVEATSNKSNTEVDIATGLRLFVEAQQVDLNQKLLPTYLPEIDSIIGGFEYSDLVIIAGAASMGKTSFMLKLLQNFLRQDKKIAIFSLEMSNNQLLTRLISMETNVKIKNIRYNTLDELDWAKIHTAIGFFEKKKFTMDGQSNMLQDVLAKIKKFKIRDNIDVVFIDYLQLITDGKAGKGNREQEVAKIARSLKNIAKELGIVVIALSQLSRALTQRDDKRPILSDLRESGEIEQAADTIMFAFRQEYYEMSNPRDVQDAEIIIAKGRNVGTGTAYLKFTPATTKFISPIADNYVEVPMPFSPVPQSDDFLG